jgi:arginine decarboxylase
LGIPEWPIREGDSLKFNFCIMMIEPGTGGKGALKASARHLSAALKAAGTEVERLAGYAPLLGSAQKLSQASALVVALDDVSPAAVTGFCRFVREIRARNGELPIFLLDDADTAVPLPNDVLKELHGSIHTHEDTADFVARQILREAQTYIDTLAPPFFKALLTYAQNANHSWHCPGHSGGVAFLKSPVGRMFHQFFGENLLQADVCNAVGELGQILDHTGAAAAAEQNAARVFNADHLYFVTNGTSTANKIVWHANVGPEDIVVVDRNCHKSVLHAIIMTGATPVYLNPTRNHHGIIGPIPAAEFTMAGIQRKIAAHPLIDGNGRGKGKAQMPRLLTITQSTYDGILYNVASIQRKLDGQVGALHFDEAWLPHAAFHPLYRDMHAIAKDRPRPEKSMIFATQSTHKTLAGLSQASQILVREAEDKKLNHHVFNESYLMHTSTSPQYSIIASCDVAAAMMDGAAGQALVEESLREAEDFRRSMRRIEKEWGKADWWFKVWGPQESGDSDGDGAGTGLTPHSGSALHQDRWLLKPGQAWHGFGEVEEGFNMLDPTKATILTPGLNMYGSFADQGIPASVVTKYLSEHGVIVEKCGLYSFFIMFTIGITKGRWATLVTALQQFKDAFEKNDPIAKAMPKFAALQPRYARLGLKDLCTSIHSAYRAADVARMTTAMYLEPAVPAMKPAAAFAMMAHEQEAIERVPIDRLEGRITAVLLTPYPPGIPLLVPGERFHAAIVDYLKFARAFGRDFPGFETDVHGLVTEIKDGAIAYCVDCVRE